MTTTGTFKWFVFLLLFAFSNNHLLYAQKAQALHWYFGDHYGLDFTSGTPVPDYSSSMYTYEACATVSDKNGELLFYTNGGGRANQAICGHIWNRNHEIMDGGNLGYEMGGGYSAAQGVLAFEKPGADNVYSLITVDENETLFTDNINFPKGKGCNYFEIDMNANGGLGKVTLANKHLFTPAFEYQAATIHENCEDYWLIVPTGHYKLLDNPDVADSFYVYLISNNGPTVLHKIPITEGTLGMGDEYGVIKISPDGSHLLFGAHLYDFDNSTGLIEYNVDLYYIIGLYHDTPAAFSPNSRFLYKFELIPNDSVSIFRVAQYDLLETNPDLASVVLVETKLIEYAVIGAPQLAPDGKLYFMIQNGFFTSPTSLATIHSPNVKGVNANVDLEVLTISNVPDSRFLQFGQYPDNIFKYEPELPDHLNDSINLLCQIATPITLKATAGRDNYIWSNGSTADSIIAYQEGLYWVEYWSDCKMGADTFHIIYENDFFEVDLGPDYTLCGSDSILLKAPDLEGLTYEWQDGSDENSLLVSEAGFYWLSVEQDQCKGTDSIYIDQLSIPHFSFGYDTTLCLKKELRFNFYHEDWDSYEWQDGSDRAYYDIIAPGTYSLTIENDCGTITDEITVDYISCYSCPVYIPNVFSPDRNGQNDEFKIASPCPFVDFQLQIYDRWGNHVFKSTNSENGWDGMLKGRIAQIGVYVYRLDYKWVDRSGKLHEEGVYGDLLLLR